MNTLLEIIKEIECLLWGIVIVVALYIVLKHAVFPFVQLRHERKMKADAFEREKEWYFIKSTEKPLDIEKELKEYKEKSDELQNKEKELKERTESLNKEKEKFEKKVLQTKIEVYDEIIKTINK